MLLQMALFHSFIYMCVIYMYHIFIHFSVDGHLGCFHVLAIVNSAAVNIGVHISLFFKKYIYLLFGCTGFGLQPAEPLVVARGI